MKGEYLGTCQKCGREDNVTTGSVLKMCWRCAMIAADKVRERENQVSGEYDWRKTITAIKKKNQLGKESVVAFALGIQPQVLSMVKKNKRSMPANALKILKEKYAECVSFKNKDLQA